MVTYGKSNSNENYTSNKLPTVEMDGRELEVLNRHEGHVELGDPRAQEVDDNYVGKIRTTKSSSLLGSRDIL